MTDSTLTERQERERQAHAIVRELPVLFEANGFPQWMATPRSDLDSRPYDLVHQPTGARIWCRFDNGKLEFHPTWPRDDEGTAYTSPRDWGVTGHGEKYPTAVYCDPKRGPSAIARDVSRRLLTDYLPMYEKCLTSREVRRKERHSCKLRAAAIGAELDPYVYRGKRADNTYRAELHNAPGALYGSFEVGSHDSVRIDLRGVPGDLAVYIAKAIKLYLVAQRQSREDVP
jgi:hypothetical protein